MKLWSAMVTCERGVPLQELVKEMVDADIELMRKNPNAWGLSRPPGRRHFSTPVVYHWDQHIVFFFFLPSFQINCVLPFFVSLLVFQPCVTPDHVWLLRSSGAFLYYNHVLKLYCWWNEGTMHFVFLFVFFILLSGTEFIFRCQNGHYFRG